MSPSDRLTVIGLKNIMLALVVCHVLNRRIGKACSKQCVFDAVFSFFAFGLGFNGINKCTCTEYPIVCGSSSAKTSGYSE